MQFPTASIGKVKSGIWREKDSGVHCGCVECEVPFGHPSGNVK